MLECFEKERQVKRIGDAGGVVLSQFYIGNLNQKEQRKYVGVQIGPSYLSFWKDSGFLLSVK